ncbi:MAG: hypothetical protein WC819_06195 [Parcubacteria group bacterium]
MRTCGVCGPADGVAVGTAPTVGLCAYGTASPVPPSLSGNTWTWTCKGSDNSTTAEDASCSAPFRIDGVCSSAATGTYTISETAYRGALCSSGTPTETPIFPTYGQTVTWGCNGIGTGTSTSPTACSATRERPASSCGPDNNVFSNTIPTDPGLCGTDSTPSTVTFDTAGNWHWTCTHTSPAAIPQSVDCQAPSCLATMPIDLQPYVYFGTDGTPNNAIATVTCPNVCCIIDSSNGAITVCNGTTGEIPVFPGSHSYPAECWFDDDHDRTNDGIDEPKVSYNPGRTISTMCTARSCNSQGTCQSTPEVTNSADSCTSTCNSDADCTTGRMIETRP